MKKFYAIIKGTNEVQEFEAESKKAVKEICKANGWKLVGSKVYTADEWQDHLIETAHPVDSDEDEVIVEEPQQEDATEEPEQVSMELPEVRKPVSTENAESLEKKNAPKLRGSRWTKIHEPGQGNFETADNVMDITLGENRIQAEILYNTKTVRTFKKAAYWLFKSLGAARADQLYAIITEAHAQVENEAEVADKAAEKIETYGAGWNCLIENMGEGRFKAQLSWSTATKE